MTTDLKNKLKSKLISSLEEDGECAGSGVSASAGLPGIDTLQKKEIKKKETVEDIVSEYLLYLQEGIPESAFKAGIAAGKAVRATGSAIGHAAGGFVKGAAPTTAGKVANAVTKTGSITKAMTSNKAKMAASLVAVWASYRMVRAMFSQARRNCGAFKLDKGKLNLCIAKYKLTSLNKQIQILTTAQNRCSMLQDSVNVSRCRDKYTERLVILKKKADVFQTEVNSLQQNTAMETRPI